MTPSPGRYQEPVSLARIAAEGQIKLSQVRRLYLSYFPAKRLSNNTPNVPPILASMIHELVIAAYGEPDPGEDES